MGIGPDTLYFLEFLRSGNFLPRNPKLVELGAQQLNNDFLRAGSEVERLGSIFQIGTPFVLPKPGVSHIVHGDHEGLDASAPVARDFWIWLGFEYASIDVDGTPGSIPLDLNYDSAPPELEQKFDLVTNFGTTEHVANQLNAFKVIHDLTAIGGIMMHNVPAQGMFNHGLVNYNPKFFWYLARSNGYKLLYIDFGSSNKHYNLPNQNVRELTGFWGHGLSAYTMADAAIRVILQKIVHVPFIPPLDVDTGTKSDIAIMRERYWSVFDRPAFDAFVEATKPWWKRTARKLARPAVNALRAVGRRPS
jgi:hypothetical protein